MNRPDYLSGVRTDGLARRVDVLRRRVEQLERAPWPKAAVEEEPVVEAVPDVYLLACDSTNTSAQYLLRMRNSRWSLVASGNLLTIADGTFTPPVGGYGRQLAGKFWASLAGLTLDEDTDAWRSDDKGATWTSKATYTPVIDYPHGLPVVAAANGTLWAARREAGDIFRIVSSNDDGDTWSTSYTAPDDLDGIYHAAAHPTNSNVIAFAGYTAAPLSLVYVTTDGGSNWTRTELNDSLSPLSDSTCLLFMANGALLYATLDSASPNDILRVYKAPAPYTAFSENDVLNEVQSGPFDGPMLALARSPLFIGTQWPGMSGTEGRIWRSKDGETWTELAEPFAAGIIIYGLYYGTVSGELYAVGADGATNALSLARARRAGTGSPSWTDITSDVNTAAGVTLAVLAAQMLWEAA